MAFTSWLVGHSTAHRINSLDKDWTDVGRIKKNQENFVVDFSTLAWRTMWLFLTTTSEPFRLLPFNGMSSFCQQSQWQWDPATHAAQVNFVATIFSVKSKTEFPIKCINQLTTFIFWKLLIFVDCMCPCRTVDVDDAKNIFHFHGFFLVSFISFQYGPTFIVVIM